MSGPTVIDTGPLVALLDASEREHPRVVQVVQGLPAPFLTAEAVLAEACFLLRRVHGGPRAVLRLVQDGLLRVELSIVAQAAALEASMAKSASVPMSLADACLVRLVELNPGSRVLTFDSDFLVYRQHRNRRIPLLGPWF